MYVYVCVYIERYKSLVYILHTELPYIYTLLDTYT